MIDALILALTVLDVRGIVWEVGPCAFTSEGEFEYCCCSLQSYCWGYNAFSEHRSTCCGSNKCPADSQISLLETTPWQRLHLNSTFATYQRGGYRMSLSDMLNCEQNPDWREFRMRLQRHHPTKLTESLKDEKLVSLAYELLSHYNLSHSNSDELFARISFEHFILYSNLYILDRSILMPQDMFCLYGYMSASFVWALKVKDRRFLSEASTFMRAVNLQELDVSSSTFWPISSWDLEFNFGQGRPRQLKPLAASELPLPQSKALSMKAVTAVAVRSLQISRTVHLVVAIYHPSLDLELVGLLLRHFPDLQITWAFHPMKSSYTNSSMASHVCREWPHWCAHPHIVKTLLEGDPPSDADLSLCSLFWLCRDLEKWMRRKLPLVSLFGGFPVNSYSVRDGTTTVDDELEPIWDYLQRTTSAAPAVLLSDAPYTSELLHSHTGILLPVYRPVCPYLSEKWSRESRSILIPKATSGAKSSASEWMVSLLRGFAEEVIGDTSELSKDLSEGSDLHSFGTSLGTSLPSALFVLQRGFLSFKSLATFKGVAYLPGPHSWVVCQWRELYNMNLPLLLPEKKDLMSHSHYWIDRLYNNLRHVPPENWMPKQRFWSLRHPFSPMPLVFNGSLYVKSHMYWSQWLEFFTWPHVQFYKGLPDLIRKATKLNFRAISERMSRCNQKAAQDAHDFWLGILPTLLPKHVAQVD